MVAAARGGPGGARPKPAAGAVTAQRRQAEAARGEESDGSQGRHAPLFFVFFTFSFNFGAGASRFLVP
jgi:hypothetical protein